MNGICPVCIATIYISSSKKIGGTIDCYKCGTSLEIISLHPVEFDWPFDERQTNHYDFNDNDYYDNEEEYAHAYDD